MSHIGLLKESAEQKVGRRMTTPKDFEYLRDCIYEECHEMLSISTLKRLWGYNKYDNTPRKSTLNPIARYVGFRDWDDFLQQIPQNEKQEIPEQVPISVQKHTHRPIKVYAFIGFFVLIVVLCGAFLLKWNQFEESNDALALEDPLPPSGKRLLRKGQDCFRTIDDYLMLFGIEASDTAYFRPLPSHKEVYVWGPEFQHPVWHNDGDTTRLMPTITEYWTPLPGEEEFQNEEYVRLANEKLYYERLEKDELRLTFMKNIIDGFYVFLGVYRMDRENSTKEKTVWKRVADQCDLGNLDKIESLRNH